MTRTELCTFDRREHDPTEGLFIARVPGRTDIAHALFRAADFRQLHVTEPGLSLSVVASEDKQATVLVSAQTFAHAVHFDLPAGSVPEDDYFDLLPGESRDVLVQTEGRLSAGDVTVSSVKSPTR